MVSLRLEADRHNVADLQRVGDSRIDSDIDFHNAGIGSDAKQRLRPAGDDRLANRDAPSHYRPLDRRKDGCVLKIALSGVERRLGQSGRRFRACDFRLPLLEDFSRKLERAGRDSFAL